VLEVAHIRTCGHKMTKSQLLSGGSILAAQLLSGTSRLTAHGTPRPGAPGQAGPVPKDRTSNSFSPAHLRSSIARAGPSRRSRKSDDSSTSAGAPDGGDDDSGKRPDDDPEGLPQEATAKDDRFLTSKAVRARYGGCSDMWIYRRLHDGSSFPRPLLVCGRRFWKLSALIAWERSRAKGAA
jgi:predicted DNA-binding transcriptional regulator AlpA